MAAKKTLSEVAYPSDLPRRDLRRFRLWMDGFEPMAKEQHAGWREAVSAQVGRSRSRTGRSPSPP